MALMPHEQPAAIVCAQAGDLVPNSYVQSCTECCREKALDGGPNINGMLQKSMMRRTIDNVHGHMEWTDCGRCPVPLYKGRLPAKTGDGRYIYWKGTDERLTADDLMRLEMDGDPVDLYCEFRDN